MTTKYNSPYTPSYLKAARYDTKPVQTTYAEADLSNSNHDSTGSFKYDSIGFPLKSTQQLNVDWSKFENHCFFSSAEVKVNEAFNKIINWYPFDGSKREVEAFIDSLTGFEKWVFDRFPTWSGALHFSGTKVDEDPIHGFAAGLGTWISVKDKSGYLHPELSKNSRGDVILNPQDESTSLSIETLLHLPNVQNDTQIVFQKMSSPYDGFTFHLEPSATNTVTGVFSVCSGSIQNNVSGTLKKGVYNHICLTINKESESSDVLQFYVNESLMSQSIEQMKFPKLGIDSADFLIGSGSCFFSKKDYVIPTQTLSGTMDELRVFHSVKDEAAQKLGIVRGLYATPDLKLYYRFNEPSGQLSTNASTNATVLDSSGNSLHAVINNYTQDLRINVAEDPNAVMKHEKVEFQKVLFPAYSDILTLNQTLLTSASNYDRSNPNNIIKLIPPHYLLEGASQDGFNLDNVNGDAGDPYGGDGIPGEGKIGSTQVILSFLYIWSKFFDELKTYIDSFVTLRTVSYDPDDTIPDNFLDDMIRSYGLYLPKFFNNSTVEQFAEGQNIAGLTDIDTPLKKLQALLTRRVLSNMPDIIRSKGTQHSIRSFLRSVGIDPDNSLRIREFGGPTIKALSSVREKRTEPIGTVDITDDAFIITPFLSSSRVEPGYPQPAGSFIYADGKRIGTTDPNDGLLTSGSWNIEATFKVPPAKVNTKYADQSLFRIMTSGSSTTRGLLANVVATQAGSSPKTSPTLKAFVRPSDDPVNSPILTMSITMSGSGIFDGDRWNVSLGCIRNDSDNISSDKQSLYYLRAGRADTGEIVEQYVTASYFYEKSGSENNLFRKISPTYNASGSFICLGGGDSVVQSTTYPFLNNSLYVDDVARTSYYSGWVSGLRFWSKDMTLAEWREHVRNPKSSGVSDPKKNYNFVENISGSFEKLRLETLVKQPTKMTDDTGEIGFLDFSLNTEEVTKGSGFVPNANVVLGDLVSYSYLATKFDEASNDDKVRIRSFYSSDLVAETPGAVQAPSYLSYESFLKEEPQDDLRLSIEFSMVDSLDKDIVSMFSSYDLLNDMLGRPELMFSPDYPDLEIMRDVYFNRLSGKPDFRKFLEFYRWFDISISSFIEQLVPSKTRYKGTNFVIESHLLERHKNMYKHDQNYVGKKQVIDDSLLVQQIVGSLRKY